MTAGGWRMTFATALTHEARKTSYPANGAATFPVRQAPDYSAAPTLRPSRIPPGMPADRTAWKPAMALRPSQIPAPGLFTPSAWGEQTPVPNVLAPSKGRPLEPGV